MQVIANSANITDPPWGENSGAKAGPSGEPCDHKIRWPANWDKVAKPETDAEASVIVDICCIRLQDMQLRLSRAAEERPRRQAMGVQRSFLHSQSALIGAVAYARDHKWRNLTAAQKEGHKSRGTRTTDLQVVNAGLALNMWAYSGEPVHLKEREKPNGEVHPSFAYGLREYARQHLATIVAMPFAQITPRQFLYNGGVPALFEWLGQNLQGTWRVITTDVPSCYLMLDREHVINGGLIPSAVTKSVLFDPIKEVEGPTAKNVGSKRRPILLGMVSSGNTYAEFLNGLGDGTGRGIPPGAALASLVAETRLHNILVAVEGVAEGVMAASFADNIIILVPNAAAAEASKNALYNAVLDECGDVAAEILQVRTEIIAPSKTFSFLKCRLRMSTNGLTRRMCPGRGEEFLCRLAIEAYEKKLTKTDIKRRVDGWLTAHNYDPKAFQIAVQAYKDHDI